MQLADNHALGSIDDECPVLGHQRHVTEEHFLLFDVANAAIAGFGVFVENREADGHLQRSRIGHAALFALIHVILQLQADRVAALGAEVRSIGVVGSAIAAEHIASMERIGDYGVSAITAGGAQVMQPLQVAAFALPVADGVIHEIKLGNITKIGNGEHGGKHGLQSGLLALAGQPVHLQKTLVGALLDFNQIRNLNGRGNFGKV